MRLLKSLLIFAISSATELLSRTSAQSISTNSAANSAEFTVGKYKLHFEEQCQDNRCFGWVKRTGNGSRKVKTITWKRCTEAKIRQIKKLNREKKLKLDFKLPSCVPSSSNATLNFKKQ